MKRRKREEVKFGGGRGGADDEEDTSVKPVEKGRRGEVKAVSEREEVKVGGRGVKERQGSD